MYSDDADDYYFWHLLYLPEVVCSIAIKGRRQYCDLLLLRQSFGKKEISQWYKGFLWVYALN